MSKTYGWQPGSSWGTDPLWSIEINGDRKIYFYHNDHLGTSQRLTNKDGKQVWSMQAEAFGNTTPMSANSITNNLRLPGQYYDEETQNHYNYFRDYNPDSGRYIESDPIGLKGGINLYVYAGNNPLVYIDPLGENPWAGIGVGIGVIAKALQKCAKDRKCRCQVIYAAYKGACNFPGCKDEKIDCCLDPDCKYIKFKTAMARACYSLRSFYISQGCDSVFPTRRDHPKARDQALDKYINCQKALAKCLQCSGGSG